MIVINQKQCTMNTINLQTRKLNIIEYLTVMQDEEILSKIEALVEKSKKSLFHTTKRFTKQDLIDRAQKAEADIQSGNIQSQHDLEIESQSLQTFLIAEEIRKR